MTPGQPTRSLFVTNLSWLVLAIGVLSIVTALVQGVTWVFTESIPWLKDPKGAQNEEDSRVLLLIVFVVYLAFSTMIAGVGWALLRRRGWARGLLLAFLWLGIAAYLAVALLAVAILILALATAGGGDGVIGMAIMSVVAIPFLAVGGGVCALFWWLARRLRSPEVRREFEAA